MARPQGTAPGLKVTRTTNAKGVVVEYFRNRETGENYGTDRAAAEARFAEWRASLVPSTSATAGSLADLITAYYKSDEFTTKAPRTRYAYRALLEELRQDAGTMPVRLITTMWIERLKTDLLPTRRKCNKMLAVLRVVLRVGKRLGYCTSEVTAAIAEVPKARVQSRDQQWRQDQIDAFMAAAPERLQFAMMLLLWTAQRFGDVIGMTKGQVSEHNGRLYIALRQEKTSTPINLAVHRELEPWLRKRLANPDGMMLLLNRRGGPYSYFNFVHQWDAVQQAAGITGVVRHDLRRTAVVNMAAHGVSTALIRNITGHSSSVLDTYLPPTTEGALAAVEQWERGQAAAPNVVMLATKRKPK